MSAWITRLGHALPGPALAQADITAWLERRLDPGSDPKRLHSFARHAGVGHRHAVFDLAGEECARLYPIGAPHADALERSRAFVRHAPPLAAAAVRAACPEGLPAISHLVVATCTGAVAPGLDLLLVELLDLPRSTKRVMVGFMGCYAAIPALRLAADTVRADPAAKVLVVCCELSSLHLHPGPADDDLVAACLFGDGAAAAVVEGTPSGCALRLLRDACTVAPASGDAMAYIAAADGFRLRLAPSIAGSLGEVLPELSNRLLAGVERAALRWVVHPGGPRILDGVERALGLPAGALASSRAALAAAGNRSSGTVLAILADACRQPWRGPLAVYAFGPGLTAESLLLEREN